MCDRGKCPPCGGRGECPPSGVGECPQHGGGGECPPCVSGGVSSSWWRTITNYWWIKTGSELFFCYKSNVATIIASGKANLKIYRITSREEGGPEIVALNSLASQTLAPYDIWTDWGRVWSNA